MVYVIDYSSNFSFVISFQMSQNKTRYFLKETSCSTCNQRKKKKFKKQNKLSHM